MPSLILNWSDNSYTETEQRIYRSLSPMDVENLPAPIGTVGPNITYYEDTDVVLGTIYYYIVSAIMGSYEKLSDEVKVRADYWPQEIGESFGGGHYLGDIEVSGKHYNLIAASQLGRVEGLQWKTSDTTTLNTSSTVDGKDNTNNMDPLEHPAAEHCINYRGGSFNDWYLPSLDEAALILSNLDPASPTTPADFQTGGSEAFTTTTVWSSTESTAANAHTSSSTELKTSVALTCPVRRIEYFPQP